VQRVEQLLALRLDALPLDAVVDVRPIGLVSVAERLAKPLPGLRDAR
jgi:hypothetical protein